MGYTNTTPQFGLPQYAPADTPQREDFNKAFKTISENMGKGGSGAVNSVNGQTGVVVLNAEDIGAIPVSEKGSNGGVATVDNEGYVVQPVRGGSGAVNSVNGQTGVVVLNAEDIGAVSKAGDTMTGKLTIQTANYANQLEIYRTGTTGVVATIYRNDNGRLGAIGISNAKEANLFIGDDTSNGKTIYHSGNRPKGTYTGNGSTTKRAINTNTNWGKGVIITSSEGSAILTVGSGIAIKDDSVNSISAAAGNYDDGNINIASTNICLNKNGVVYTYRVI